MIDTRLPGDTPPSPGTKQPVSVFTEQELQALLQASSDVILLLDEDGRYLKVAENSYGALYRPNSELIGRRVTETLPAASAARSLDVIRRALTEERSVSIDYSIPTPEGVRHYTAVIQPLPGERRVLWLARDVTAQHTAELALAQRYAIERLLGRFSTQFINIPAHAIDAAIDSALADMGQHFQVARAYIYRLADGYMTNTHSWRAPSLASGLGYQKPIACARFPWLMQQLGAGEVIRVRSLSELPPEAKAERETFSSRGAGAIVLVPIVFSGRLDGFIGFDSGTATRDWTDEEIRCLKAAGEIFASALQRQQFEDKILRLAYYDELTNLPNRAQLRRHLRDSVEARGQPFVVAMLDLDDSSTINDLLGHDIGDQLLREVARRLTRFLGPTTTVGRWGGDAFMLIIPVPASTEELVRLARALQEELSRPLTIDGHELRLSCCAGVARFPDDARDVDSLIRFTEMALHQAKQHGRGTLRRYSRKLKDTAARRNQLLVRLRRAVEHGDFSLHYQPLVEAESCRIVGAEALLRWYDEELGEIKPDQFIPVAEEGGLIGLLGEWVLRKACEEMQHWLGGAGQPRISVNVSGRQLLDNRLAQALDDLIHGGHIAPQQIELEITETALMEREAAGLPLLQHLHELGVGIAVDDFGTGYSSLAKIKHMPVNVLKIDRSFIQDIFLDSNDRAIVIAILALAKQLQLKVVAEGVETAEQLAFLRENHCDIIQGFIFSPPLPSAEFRRLWATGLQEPALPGST